MAKDLLTTAGRIRHALDKLSRLYPEHFAHRTPTMDDEAEPRGGWLTADCTIPSGESLVRHLLYESHGNEETAPQDDTLCWLPAHPGLSGALPQILRGAGFRTVIMPPRHRSPMPTCCWEGIDGTHILLHFLSADRASSHDDPPLRTWVGELYPESYHGAGTLPMRSKREGLRCEFLLRDAEFFATIMPAGAGAYPAAELEEAWKLVLRQQCSAASGSHTSREAARDYRRVHVTAEKVIDSSMNAFAALVDTSKLSHPIIVWNTLPFARSGLVSLPWEGADDVVVLAPNGQPARTQLIEEAGERRLLAEVLDVPSMGYLIFDLLEGAMPEEVIPAVTDAATANARVLENDLVRVEIDERGGVASFFDKQAGRELIAGDAVGNLFQRFDDRLSAREAGGECAEDLLGPADISVRECGALRASLRVVRELTPRAHLVQDICLEANSRRLDFVTHIDWQEEQALLKVAFPVNIHNTRASYEIQFGHVERPTHQNARCDAARAEAPAHKWADLSESDYGIALLNDGRYSYDIHGNVMRLTLLRAPKGAGARREWGGHDFTYSLLPHRGEVTNSGVPLGGYDLNVPLYVRRIPVQEGILAQTHSYFRLDKPNLIIESVKRAEDGNGIIIRLYEAFRRRGTARLLINGLCSAASRTDLRERTQQELEVQGGAILLHYRPFEIITLRLR